MAIEATRRSRIQEVFTRILRAKIISPVMYQALDDQASVRQLRWLLISLVGVVLVLLMLGGYIAKETIETSRGSFEIAQQKDAVVDQLRVFESIQADLGYTNFIHNFKNGVLRSDIEKLDQAAQNLLKARQDLNQILTLFRTTQSDFYSMLQPIAVLQITLNHYLRMVDVAKEMLRSGASAQEIDAQVKIDDEPARKALLKIRALIAGKYDYLYNRLNQQSEEFRKVWNLMIATAICLTVVGILLLVLYIHIQRHVHALNDARDQLSNVSERMRRQINAIAADIDPTRAKQKRIEQSDSYSPIGLFRIKQTLKELTSQTEMQQQELLKYTEELELSNEELKRFAYVASHDLQEPLRKIQTNIDLIEHRCADQLTEDVANRLERVTKAANSMRQLIDDLLAYSRSGTQTLTNQMIDLSSLCSRIVESYQPTFEERGGHLSSTLAEGPEFWGDKAQLTQMITNLLSNAAKYCEPGSAPKAHLDLSFQDGFATIVVSDEGIGFEQKYAEQIFEPFQRLHGRGVYEGSGIGLAIVMRVAQRHGGKVTAKPGEKAGAVFTVVLPIQDKPGKEE
jgi:signal transduction histidine kinase